MPKRVKKNKSSKKKRESQVSAQDPYNYLNRELSWLEFNARVLNEACDERTPLLERFRFLAIYTSNLDEFIMKRVGGIKRYKESEYTYTSIDGLNADTQLDVIRQKVFQDNKRQEECYLKLKRELETHNIILTSYSELSKDEKSFCTQYFLDNFYPILTPLSVDAGKPFPFISNLSFSFGIYLQDPMDEDFKIFSRVKIPDIAQTWVQIPNTTPLKLVKGSEIIEYNLSHLYRGMEILEVMPFKVTRNADWDHDDEDTEDLLETISESINERRLQEPIRLEYLKDDFNQEMLDYLISELDLKENDIYYYEKNLDYLSLHSIANLDIGSLKYREWRPVSLPWYQTSSLFERIKEKDRLIHHPYENFTTSVEKFITSAAHDPNVLSIKMTLYRTGDNSPFIKALIEAAEEGKQVVCLIELKARFDEKRNIYWARKMEEAGVHVVYGIVGLKTHTKIAMIVRRETNGSLLQYTHIATGNYNSKTARLYTDIGLFTVDKRITAEVHEVFNYLTGSSLKLDYDKLLVSPINAKSQFIKKIYEQIKLKKAGKEAHIIAKMNAFDDIALAEALYKASSEGVQIDLIVRGFCTLKPLVKDLSENIRIISVIGRFLEHSRVFYFSDGEVGYSGEYFIGSADWMHRNLHGRVEVMTPILAEEIKKSLYEFFNILLSDHRSAWELKADGQYTQRNKAKELGTHDKLMEVFSNLLKATET